MKPYQAPIANGEYRVVDLTLERGLPVPGGKDLDPKSNQTVRLAFRGEKRVNWWPLPQGSAYLRELDSTVALEPSSLSGTLHLRQYSAHGGPAGDLTLTFNLTREAERFSGTCEIKTGIPVKGVTFPVASSVAGWVLPPADPVSPDAAQWASLFGPQDTMATTQPALVDALSRARPVWRSEVSLPVSFGNAPDMRYLSRARASGPGGGGSSPVVVDGVVYQGFFRPNPECPPSPPGWFPERNWKGKSLDEYMADWSPAEKEDYVAALRLVADDHVVAIDARTGATLWETVWPRRSFNYQTHKHRGLSGVPLVAAGKVFYPNLHGHLMVMDAKTGAPLWEYPEFENTPDPKGQKPTATPECVALLVGDPAEGGVGMLIWYNAKERRVVALSPEDGAVRWKDGLKLEHRYPRLLGADPTRRQTNDRWPAPTGSEAESLCWTPNTGEALWVQGGPTLNYISTPMNDALLRGDLLVTMAPIKDAKPASAPARRAGDSPRKVSSISGTASRSRR